MRDLLKMFPPSDILVAVGLLTRIPVPLAHGGASAVWAYPVAGLVVGAGAGLVALLALATGTAPGIAAGLAIATQIILTGALHEDGLADSADGLWGGWEKERRLEIMRDSRIGAYGVLALVVSVLVRWAALTVLFGEGWVLLPLLAAGVLSRAPMGVLMWALPNARGHGLSNRVGRPKGRAVLAGLGLAFLIACLTIGRVAVLLAVLLAIATAFAAMIAKAKIGGQTGDILGATQQLSEIAVLIVLSSE